MEVPEYYYCYTWIPGDCKLLFGLAAWRKSVLLNICLSLGSHMGNKDFGAALPEVFEYSSYLLQSMRAQETQHYKIKEKQRKMQTQLVPQPIPLGPGRAKQYLHLSWRTDNPAQTAAEDPQWPLQLLQVNYCSVSLPFPAQS